MANRDKEEAEVCLCSCQRAGDTVGKVFMFNWQETKRERVLDKEKKIKTQVKETHKERKKREGAREKVQQEQECKRAKDREGERARDIQRN